MARKPRPEVVVVSPDEVQNLVYILATAPGSLFLALRNTNDRGLVNLRTTSLPFVTGPEPDFAFAGISRNFRHLGIVAVELVSLG